MVPSFTRLMASIMPGLDRDWLPCCDRIDYNKSAFLAQGSTAMMALLVESDIMRLAEIIFVRGRALWKLIDAIF